ncbi:lymphocyte antigen 6 family member pge isoform X1 [Hippocampus zosterae]|uniref:lymphocyte antigen 6 family member pge isoform X1 n=1 Tax=Hippocampus zosterae TaxID=109293 RepID=UPI00223DB1D0|nr:lymphocyte antigen 6 family member pge isoform X1 [Hippocampus zosterae]
MDRTPSRSHWNEKFPSPPSGWARTPYRGSGHHGDFSARGYHTYSPNSPTYSPGFNRGHRGGSPGRYGAGGRGYGGSPAIFGSGGRNFGEKQRRGNRFGRAVNFSPAAVNVQHESSGSIERYFSPSMLEDPWAALQPKHTETPPIHKQDHCRTTESSREIPD